MDISERISESVIEEIRDAIEDVRGNEICVIGRCDTEGIVSEINIVARGHDTAVPIVAEYVERGDVIIHNHPTGNLEPSGPDLDIAAKYAESGIGFYIIDNDVRDLYAVTEPVEPKQIEPLDIDGLEALLAPGGAFSSVFETYEPREQQIDMMRAVAEGFNEKRVVVVEAGTGVGKSLAYLVPSMYWASQNDERIVISTATINLQHQLLEHDIPLVQSITGLSVQATLVKGRGNYICRRRLDDELEEGSLFEEDKHELEMLSAWVETTPTGSRSDLPEYLSNETWSRVCSEADSCRGIRCARRQDCFVLKARKENAAARLLITNHHLLFSDLSIRHAGIGKDGTAVLPPFHHIVFDEAHNIERNATSFFSERISHAGLLRHLSALHRSNRRGKSGTIARLSRYFPVSEAGRAQQLAALAEECNKASGEMNSRLSEIVGDRTLRLCDSIQTQVLASIRDVISELQVPLVRLVSALSDALAIIPDEYREDDIILDVAVVRKRLEHFAANLDRALHFEDYPNEVAWIEKGFARGSEANVSIQVTPLNISELMHDLVFGTYETVVFTSATLTVNHSFAYLSGRLGLGGREDADFHVLDSPFAYRERVLLAVTTDAPEPTEQAYRGYVFNAIQKLLEISEGRGLVLFTSYHMLIEAYETIAPILHGLGIMTLKQGTADRMALLESFTRDVTSVLFATDSFWEGVDTPGDSLKIVIICRLPFRVPNDPVYEARLEAVENEGKNSFYEMSVPQAVMKLKQGFGRLMRRATDGGVVAVLDSRIAKRGYGRMFLESLPETVRSFESLERVLSEVERFLYS